MHYSSQRNMKFSISHSYLAFNLSYICVSLLTGIGWFTCVSGQSGVCWSVGRKEGVLWGILSTDGWEGLVYLFPGSLSLMHVPAYQQLGSFYSHSNHICKASTSVGWSIRKWYNYCSTVLLNNCLKI